MGFVFGMYAGRTWSIPYITKRNEWSIGICVGDSPVGLKSLPGNPVLTARDVTDVPAYFVADPFMVTRESKWFMFFEVLNARSKNGEIGLATSDDGLKWIYRQIIIAEPFHLSYPYVFEWDNEYYMIPESSQDYSVRLYKALDFPAHWSYVGNLLYGRNFKDSSVVYYQDKWWMFTCDRRDYLLLYYSDDLLGPWIEHPASPIVRGNAGAARPAGRVIIFDGKIIRYVQEGSPANGFRVHAFEITDLTVLTYQDRPFAENPILTASNDKWSEKGGHTIDPLEIAQGRWIACVDYLRESIVIGLKH